MYDQAEVPVKKNQCNYGLCLSTFPCCFHICQMEQLSGLFFFDNHFCQHGHSWEGADLASALIMILVATTVGWLPTWWWCNKGVTQVTMHTAHSTLHWWTSARASRRLPGDTGSSRLRWNCKRALTLDMWIRIFAHSCTDLIFVIFSPQMYFWAQLFSTRKRVICGQNFATKQLE